MLLPAESLEFSSAEEKYVYEPCQCCWCKAFKSGDTHCHFCMEEIEWTSDGFGVKLHLV
jgi:hypothetical protein